MRVCVCLLAAQLRDARHEAARAPEPLLCVIRKKRKNEFSGGSDEIVFSKKGGERRCEEKAA